MFWLCECSRVICSRLSVMGSTRTVFEQSDMFRRENVVRGKYRVCCGYSEFYLVAAGVTGYGKPVWQIGLICFNVCIYKKGIYKGALSGQRKGHPGLFSDSPHPFRQFFLVWFGMRDLTMHSYLATGNWLLGGRPNNALLARRELSGR